MRTLLLILLWETYTVETLVQFFDLRQDPKELLLAPFLDCTGQAIDWRIPL